MVFVSIITPATGNPLLKQAVESVQKQDYEFLEHFIVIDGQPREAQVLEVLAGLSFRKQASLMCLPYPTGTGRYNGHRIYGAAGFLVRGDYLICLDEDNWLEPEHVSSLVRSVGERGLEWGYALRNIVDPAGRFVIKDDCESLGKWPSYLDDSDFHIDVNCYFLRKNVAISIAPLWYRRAKEPGVQSVDRAICGHLLEYFPHFQTTGRYTVNYRTGSTEQSVQPEFFIRGNQVMQERYPQGFPWLQAE
ncbi:glycosyltransferase family A protein [Gloeobacter kilaueensis]|uniref:Glycosyltransferase n=1 Tax=Gloeobacter kilaueensis (strain ATCC BAA-2537 / CCAP 1431/1 / ULC 316 / JS1) TaxID=1183438 RepID=U5QLT6_GLOK1|nr:glycosyltransferase family A protein [Gloeobacter kilaueensis]AGY59947.1 glycosyltransferase [Gloeobacter kilaueensis JS1]